MLDRDIRQADWSNISDNININIKIYINVQ